MMQNILLAIQVILLALLLGGCEQQADRAPVIPAEAGEVPAEPQRQGDPQAGYAALVNKPYVSCGVPYQAYRRNAEAPSADALLPGRTGRNAELPYTLTAHTSATGVELISSNCLVCHAAYFNGKLIVGLGNEARDFTADPILAAESAGAYVEGEAATAEWRRWADRVAAIAPYTMTDTVGVNPATNLTFALMTHRDPKTLAWSQEPLLEPPPEQPLPVSVPPWWRMQKKHAMFYSGEGRGDHARWMITASTLCTDSLDEAAAIDQYAPDIRAFIASLQAPDYPFPIDRELAATGRTVFEHQCSSCHGTYGEDWTYPNRIIPLEQIGTDPEIARYPMGQGKRFVDWFNASFYGELARFAPAPGYYAPPLDGVWATAPYLHNGSVPTIEALLNSPKRPAYWSRSFESTDYDEQTLGWRYTELTHGKAGTPDPEQRKRIYDTTLKGYSNQGHTFGDALNNGERAAVLEYLKTL